MRIFGWSDKRWADQWGESKGIILVLMILLFAIGLLYVGYRVFDGLNRNFFSTSPALEDDEKPLIAYLGDHAHDMREVTNMIACWKESRSDRPKLKISTCEGDVDAFHFFLCGDSFVISRKIWEAQGPDATAYRALVFFAEFQHTPAGGNLADNQQTQDVLIQLRRHLPQAMTSARIRSVHHKGTDNHD